MHSAIESMRLSLKKLDPYYTSSKVQTMVTRIAIFNKMLCFCEQP